ncbi:hypothetical protein KKJFFJLC_00017 [Vibrio phage vB_VpaS_PGB]|nr:hypothetical protein HHKILHMN_00017 [Vibrio phage vB_VpaS_PGA]WVH05560.1 hypothetical protein KKJFFJLC_00017 [Vibrio phage vB_VpaS_PGB]
MKVSLNQNEFIELSVEAGIHIYHHNENIPAKVQVVFVESDTQPVVFSPALNVIASTTQGAARDINRIDGRLWAVAINGPATIDVVELITTDSTILTSDIINRPFNRSLAYSLNEYQTGIGVKYSMSELYVLPAGAVRYIGAIMPLVDSSRIAAFYLRHIETYDGEGEFAINQDITSGVIGVGTLIPVRTENRYYVTPSEVEFRFLGATEPTGGTWIENNVLPAQGQGAGNQWGSGFPQEGYRIYNKGDVAAIRLTNNENAANRFIVEYSWMELEAYQG